MAKSNGSITWKEDTTLIEDYCNKYAAEIGEFAISMLQAQLAEGNRVISRQNSITKAVKANLSAIERVHGIRSPFVSNQGKKPPMVLSDDEEATRPYSMETNEDGYTVLTVSPDFLTFFTKYYRMKNDDGSSIESTGYRTNENLLTRVLLNEVEANWLAGIKKARSE